MSSSRFFIRGNSASRVTASVLNLATIASADFAVVSYLYRTPTNDFKRSFQAREVADLALVILDLLR